MRTMSKSMSNVPSLPRYVFLLPQFVAVKEPKEATEEPDDDNIEIVLDDVIENEELGMKKEFNVFVERDLVPQIKLLKQNYIEKQDLIKVSSLSPRCPSAAPMGFACPRKATSSSTSNSSKSAKKPPRPVSLSSPRK